MTHTFKLARRMARLRSFTLAALVAATACGEGDDLVSTAPSVSPPAQPGNDSPGSIDPAPPAADPVAPASTGIPFGPFAAWDETSLKAGTEVFTASLGAVDPENILERLAGARAEGVKLILAMTGGEHARYMKRGAFDLATWQAAMAGYNTPEIKAAVAAAVADGTIIGNSVMDEPHVKGLGDGNTWGPPGTMSKEVVDGMCGYVKTMFPTLPAGVVHSHDSFEPDKSYGICDFLVAQYAWRRTAGDVGRFRDEALALARRDGMAIVFSMNIMNGGIQSDRRGPWNCPSSTTGGRGTFKPNCRMTPQQVRDWGIALGVAGCALVMWRYDEAFMANQQNLQAFRDIGAALATTPASSCRRS